MSEFTRLYPIDIGPDKQIFEHKIVNIFCPSFGCSEELSHYIFQGFPNNYTLHEGVARGFIMLKPTKTMEN